MSKHAARPANLIMPACVFFIRIHAAFVQHALNVAMETESESETGSRRVVGIPSVKSGLRLTSM